MWLPYWSEQWREVAENDKKIAIYSDSQAAIPALETQEIWSKFTRGCKETFSRITGNNTVLLAWISGREHISGKEEADRFDKEDVAERPFSPEPFSELHSEMRIS